MNTDTKHISRIVEELEQSSKNIAKLNEENLSIGEDINILYLEDNESDAQHIQEILNIEYLNIDIAKSYSSAIEKFQNKYYNAFIVDLNLSGKYSGFDFIFFLQKMEIKNIIVLTGLATEDISQKCQDVGIEYVFSKDDLLKLIKGSSSFLRSLLKY